MEIIPLSEQMQLLHTVYQRTHLRWGFQRRLRNCEERMKNKQIKLLVERYPGLKAIENEVFNAYQILENCYAHGGKLLVAGNGGSAADAEHIVGELMKGFKLPRKPDADFAEKLVAENQELGSILAENLQGALPAIALDGHPALSTAYMNDCEPLLCTASQWLWQGRRCVSGNFHKRKQ